MEPGPTPPQALFDVLEDFVKRADEDRRASFVMAVTALSLMIDAGVATTDQTVARIDRIRDSLPPALRTERLDRQVELVQGWLRFRAGTEESGAGTGPVGKARPGPRWTPEVIPGGGSGPDRG
ncbi:hypothetical protein [Arenibaculum pallidiluteum]|uniref:hypothetical protein n=1 Tax=Arenibaculum pallidiluteum TaxID=2812559 RepID=UPI001A9613CB|nr:hypothetical protein [Arenibaculum pallidiluteum]